MRPNQGTAVDAWRRELVDALRRDVAEDDLAVEAPVATGRREILAFHVGEEVYGFDIGDVAEILLPRAVTPLPRTPPFVLGVASLRGAVLPVLDLAGRLGMDRGEPGRSSRILVVRDGEEAMGLWVDRVRGVVRFADGGIASNATAATVDPEFLKGIGYDREDSLVAVLDAARLCDFEVRP